MPIKPQKPCNKPGCRNLTRERYCEQHANAVDKQRGTAHERGYNSKWARYSRRFLRLNPLCVCEECKQAEAEGRVPKPAEVTDHIIPHKGDMELFWDPNNHQPMNKKHHDRKTAKENGGFGNGINNR